MFFKAPALRPAEVAIDPNLIRQYEAEMAQAAQLSLPDEDDVRRVLWRVVGLLIVFFFSGALKNQGIKKKKKRFFVEIYAVILVFQTVCVRIYSCFPDCCTRDKRQKKTFPPEP